MLVTSAILPLVGARLDVTLSVWLRSWWRGRLLTLQFALTIAVGMGAATAVVSLMLALGYQPLPFRDPGRLVAVWERVESGTPVTGISGPDLVDFTEATHDIFATLRRLRPVPTLVA